MVVLKPYDYIWRTRWPPIGLTKPWPRHMKYHLFRSTHTAFVSLCGCIRLKEGRALCTPDYSEREGKQWSLCERCARTTRM
jgi:hypothetical protein